MHHHNIGVFWGPYSPLTPPKYIPACLGGFCPSIRSVVTECKASCGALGGHFCQRRPWLAMLVLVNVGHWRLTSDQPTIGIVKIVNGCKFFYSYKDPIHSWHLTRQLKKEDLDLKTLLFSWFSFPMLYGSHHHQECGSRACWPQRPWRGLQLHCRGPKKKANGNNQRDGMVHANVGQKVMPLLSS
jgi:hypothetical protein